MYVFGFLLIAFEVFTLHTNGTALEPYLIRTLLGIAGLTLLSVLAGILGAFGGADVKAIIGIAILFPTNPIYFFKMTAYPMHPSPMGVFSITVLTNALLVILAYPVYLVVSSLLTGEFSVYDVATKRVPVQSLEESVGVLFTDVGEDSYRFDLDVLRMYLQWRETTLSRVCANPWWFRVLSPIPENRSKTGDGEVVQFHRDSVMSFGDIFPKEVPESVVEFMSPSSREPDYWGAEAFIEDAEFGAYGMSPEQVRAGLEEIVSNDVVRVSPGLPFFVPLTIGLVLSLTVGDLLIIALQSIPGL